jgi:hypothetical protein
MDKNIYGEISYMRKKDMPSRAVLILLPMLFIISCKNESKLNVIKEEFPEEQIEIHEVIK